jgi:hypothetical protein
VKNNKFVADGSRRLWLGKKALASESVEQKYTAELAKADPEEKEEIRRRMTEESVRREKTLNHKPSLGTLW